MLFLKPSFLLSVLVRQLLGFYTGGKRGPVLFLKPSFLLSVFVRQLLGFYTGGKRRGPSDGACVSVVANDVQLMCRSY